MSRSQSAADFILDVLTDDADGVVCAYGDKPETRVSLRVSFRFLAAKHTLDFGTQLPNLFICICMCILFPTLNIFEFKCIEHNNWRSH